MKKQTYGILAVCIIVVIIFTVAVSANDSNPAGEAAGNAVKAIDDSYSDSVIVMSVNGTDITEKEFETFKATTNNSQASYTDEQLLNMLAEQQVLFDEAKRRGLTATNAEIDYAIDVAKAALQEPYQSEVRSFLNSYIEQLGITEDQYWENVRPEYEKSLSIGKLQDQLRMDLVTSNGTDTISTADWDTYYNDFTNQLLNSANIQIKNSKSS